MTDETKVMIVTQNNIPIDRTSGKCIEFSELFIKLKVLTHMMDVQMVVSGLTAVLL